MRFLCMHGAIGNTDNIKVQLGPLITELEKDGHTFTFLQGQVEVFPPADFQQYFGPGPHYRWVEDQGIAENSMLERIRDFPETATPEDSLRILMAQVEHKSTLYAALDHLRGALTADPEIAGVIGYSEGAGVAASLILDEQRKAEANGDPKRLKCGVFFTGWPPFTAEGYPILADETDETIDPPTLHIVGANDPFKNGAMALYNVCNEDTAVFFDTGKGHTIPRHGESLDELAQAVRNMIQMAVDLEEK